MGVLAEVDVETVAVLGVVGAVLTVVLVDTGVGLLVRAEHGLCDTAVVASKKTSNYRRYRKSKPGFLLAFPTGNTWSVSPVTSTSPI